MKDNIIQLYKVTVCDKAIDGLLGIEFKHKVSDIVFHMLPPSL